MRKYSRRIMVPKWGRRICLLESRGCPYRCSFCYVYKMFPGGWRGRSVKNVLEEVRFLHDHYEIDYFNIFDDLPFGGSRERMIEFCRGLRSLSKDIIWDCDHRPNLIHRKMIEKMKRANCVQVYMGVESGSPKMLKLLNRSGITLDEIIRAFEVCYDVGVRTLAGFMVGLPAETWEDLEASIKLAKRIPATHYRVANYVPYPGTELYEAALREGFKEPDHPEDWAHVGDYREIKLGLGEMSLKELERVKDEIESRSLVNSIKFVIKHGSIMATLPAFLTSSPEEIVSIVRKLGVVVKGLKALE